MSNHEKHEYHYGGQAIIEGVMMRGKNHFAVACRRTDGQITTTVEHIEKGILGKLKWLNRPFLRGTLALADAMILGMKSLMWSANLAMEDEQAKQDSLNGPIDGAGSSVVGVGFQIPPQHGKIPPQRKKSKVNEITLNVTLFVSMALAIVLFMYIPAFLTRFATRHITDKRVYLGLIEGGIKLTFFFLYVWGISRWKEIRRIFEFHGAEHKVINAFEAGEELTVPNVQKYTTVHVRCGTSFLLVVILVSIIVFTAIPWKFTGLPVWHAMLCRVAYKLPLLPVVAGIAYEIIKLAGGRKQSKLMRLVLGPGLLMQRITTQEPADDQVEVAIKSFESVREAERAMSNEV